jgi:hypothetical protein
MLQVPAASFTQFPSPGMVLQHRLSHVTRTWFNHPSNVRKLAKTNRCEVVLFKIHDHVIVDKTGPDLITAFRGTYMRLENGIVEST